MSKLFSLEILSKESVETVQVSMIDVHSDTGGFLICPGSAPLMSLIGHKTSLVLTLPTGALSTIALGAGVLSIDQNGNVSILLLDKTTEF
jgi:F0F1-type ATP synthase epsilon subunit